MIIDHLGIAVRSLDASLRFYRDALGLEVEGPEEVPAEGVRIAFLAVGQSRVELLEPLGPGTTVARFLDKRGEGIHHLCLRVADIEAALAALRGKGAEIIEPAPRIGAGGRRIAFIHPRSTGGVLLELVEAQLPPGA
ncbi:MAG TPA: methylmalonyl-CoA epimerase [Patescibacteria group bacterium]|nr:methylmalonyl-CoA epimerase [Patescibacteria group bacterium]